MDVNYLRGGGGGGGGGVGVGVGVGWGGGQVGIWACGKLYAKIRTLVITRHRIIWI